MNTSRLPWKLKYKDLTAADKDARSVSIGIAAFGPYISQYKHDRLEYMKSKLKWVGDKGFRRSQGWPAQQSKPSAGINSSGQYVEPSAYFRDPDDRVDSSIQDVDGGNFSPLEAQVRRT